MVSFNHTKHILKEAQLQYNIYNSNERLVRVRDTSIKKDKVKK